MDAPTRWATRWAESGAMWLTGRPDGPPLGVPTRLVRELDALGKPFDVDGVALLGERAALARLQRGGNVSCGGATRLLPATDGWLAVSLTRDDDFDLLGAWLDITGDNPWTEVANAVATRRADDVTAAATELGLAVSRLGEASDLPAIVPTRLGEAPPTHDLRSLRVIDLSSLWAGPLCGQLLADAGMDVVKVESTRRPDGARRGPQAFFDLMNGRKRFVDLDLTTRDGTAALRELLLSADVVIEASRPRALRQMGIDADEIVAIGETKVWLSITGFGRAHNRVAFGDDAAVAGGLVARDDGGAPLFCGDALADPLAGLHAAW
ncbi:MAG TPA: CoA transferase, partial [Acidimicrobiales bacterium]|nr:CoA transferase [Acidimicrobiales bacterium]